MIKTYIIGKNVRDNIKMWGAIITGLDDIYRFKRNFCSYSFINDCSSKHGYFNYYIDVEENQFFEIGEKSSYKNKKQYYQLKNNIFISVNEEDILKHFSYREV